MKKFNKKVASKFVALSVAMTAASSSIVMASDYKNLENFDSAEYLANLDNIDELDSELKYQFGEFSKKYDDVDYTDISDAETVDSENLDDVEGDRIVPIVSRFNPCDGSYIQEQSEKEEIDRKIRDKVNKEVQNIKKIEEEKKEIKQIQKLADSLSTSENSGFTGDFSPKKYRSTNNKGKNKSGVFKVHDKFYEELISSVLNDIGKEAKRRAREKFIKEKTAEIKLKTARLMADINARLKSLKSDEIQVKIDLDHQKNLNESEAFSNNLIQKMKLSRKQERRLNNNSANFRNRNQNNDNMSAASSNAPAVQFMSIAKPENAKAISVQSVNKLVRFANKNALVKTPESTAGVRTSSSSIGQKVVDIARNCINIPYNARRYGVNFDCSGLVLYAYKQVGINLYHKASVQYSNCKKISKDQLQNGDLIFWASGGNINHVGIYADGRVIHASPRGVVECNIFNSPSQYIAGYGRPY